MARTRQNRKRSGGPLRRTVKKRRVTRRRVSGASTTTRASGATSIGTFKGKRTSLRTYRNILWRDTLMKTHWRSTFDTTGNITTPNTVTNATLTLIPAMPVFYTVGGGLQQVDNAVTPPLFTGNIVLRGGICRLALANRINPTEVQNTDCCRVTVYAVWTTASPIAAGGFPASLSTMWDPSLQPDFERFGKVMWKKEAILKADGEAAQFYFKFKVQKIDQAIYTLNPRGQTLVWMVLVSQLTNTETIATPEVVDFVTSHNVSFSGDAIGTT